MSPDAADELEAGAMVGEYRIEGKLGEGGMATVYAALHPLIGKRAAVKVVNRQMLQEPDAVERFVQEAQAVNRIGHPNIVDIFSIGTLPDGRPYFVMEWLQGESLGARLARGPLSVEDAADVLNQLCLALDAVHEVGIVHRDLKPDNIFLVQLRGRAAPTVKLLDFGVAKLRHREGMNRVTRTGMAVGTPAYVSPEQARGLDIDHRSDIYALGVMTYELVTGQLPFDAASALDLMMMHVQTAPPSLGEVLPGAPAVLDDLVAAMLAKTPDARPSLADIREVLDTLRTEALSLPRASSSLPIRVRTDAALAATLSTDLVNRRRSWIAPLLVLVALAGGAIAVVMYVLSSERSSPSAPVTVNSGGILDAAAVAPSPALTTVDASIPLPVDAKLVLRITTIGARVEIDGVPIADARDGTEVPIGRAGEHVITATARGHQPLRKAIEVPSTGTIEISIALEPIARRRPKQPPAPKNRGENYTLDPFQKGDRR